MYKQGLPDHLAVAMNLFLNFKNLLIRIMSILGNRNDWLSLIIYLFTYLYYYHQILYKIILVIYNNELL
jgi:hypothetical protein